MQSMNRLVVVLCGLVATPVASGQEWTRFRGPNGSGASDCTTIPARWTEEDYLLKTALPGIGHSSPVVWGGRVFLMSADPETATRYLLCVDAETGGIVWTKSFPSTPHHLHPFNSFASSTPAVDQQRVYVAWSTPAKTTVMALDHDGTTIWEQDLGPFVSQHGFGSSPILYDDLVIVASQQQSQQLDGKTPGESHIFALDCETGQIRWKTPRRSSVVSYATPCLYRPEGGPPELICCNTADGMYSINPKSGEENWSLDVFTMRTVSSPLIAAGLIFGSTGSGGGGNYVVALRPGTSPQELYRIKSKAPYVPISVARDDLVFLWSDAGIVTCIDAPDGKVVWTKRVGGTYFASPIRAADRIYGVSTEGEVVVLAAGRDYQLLGRNPLGEPTRATPAVANHRMFLRTESHLFAIGGASP